MSGPQEPQHAAIKLPEGSWWDGDVVARNGAEFRLGAGHDISYGHGPELSSRLIAADGPEVVQGIVVRHRREDLAPGQRVAPGVRPPGGMMRGSLGPSTPLRYPGTDQGHSAAGSARGRKHNASHRRQTGWEAVRPTGTWGPRRLRPPRQRRPAGLGAGAARPAAGPRRDRRRRWPAPEPRLLPRAHGRRGGAPARRDRAGGDLRSGRDRAGPSPARRRPWRWPTTSATASPPAATRPWPASWTTRRSSTSCCERACVRACGCARRGQPFREAISSGA